LLISFQLNQQRLAINRNISRNSHNGNCRQVI
jgi:hypothetical protein